MTATPRGCFVTGTDTSVGKTRIAAALLHRLRREGRFVAGFKPVAAGMTDMDGLRINEDVHALLEAGSPGFSGPEICPFPFCDPCAPHIAAAREGRLIDRQVLLRAARALHDRADYVVVEGVGGFCVPLGAEWDTSHVACALGLPVVLVVGLRLGCLNHALLTAEAVAARHLRLAGWIANTVNRDMLAHAENIETLRHEMARRHAAPCLGVVPWLETPWPRQVARFLDAAALEHALQLQNLRHEPERTTS